MLYSIIPPIFVVLSLVGIIIFLVKKAPRVASLNRDEFGTGSEIDLREGGILNRGAQRVKKINWKAGERASLAVLEKAMKLLRFVFLKPGAIFSRWWVSIKNRRKSKIAEHVIEEQSKAADEDIINRIKSYVPEKKIIVKKTSLAVNFPEEENPVKPMISEKVAKPKTEIRDRLEELLIERIAANPRDIEAYERLGEYYMEIENFEFAKECFKQVIKLSPANRNAKYRMKKLERLLS
jgi:tetratricopeptide (TPR) repeat protein